MEAAVFSSSDRRGHTAHRLRAWLRAAGLVGVFVLVVCLLVAVSAQADPPVSGSPATEAQPAAALSRPGEPVVISGSALPQFSGVRLHDLFVYSYDGSTWRQILFQFDEVTGVDDDFVAFEDGLLDSNDQLVFMAGDAGQTADLWVWLDDPDAKAYPRYAVKVTNPLNASEEGWVYVFRSSILTRAPGQYVSWDPANNRYVAVAYTLGYSSTTHFVGPDSLQLDASGVDVLDRFKLRLTARCWHGPEWEEAIVTEEDEKLTDVSVAPDVAGPVRAGGGTLADSGWKYGWSWQSGWEFDTQDVDFELPPNCTAVDFRQMRISLDWRDPWESGMAPMTYYDENRQGGVPVDGTPDEVPATPLVTWRQVSGARGSVVEVTDHDFTSGSLANFYQDSLGGESPSTGDGLQFADAGYVWDNPGNPLAGKLTLRTTYYVLEPNQSNVGYWYRLLHDYPLEASITAEDFQPCLENLGLYYRPFPVYYDIATTFTATGIVQPPATYLWTFGDDESTSSGISVTHTFLRDTLRLNPFIPVTLKVTATCAEGVTLTQTAVQNILVFEPGQANLTHLPLIRRRSW